MTDGRIDGHDKFSVASRNDQAVDESQPKGFRSDIKEVWVIQSQFTDVKSTLRRMKWQIPRKVKRSSMVLRCSGTDSYKEMNDKI